MNVRYTQFRTADLLCHCFPRRFAYWLGLRLADRFYSYDEQGRRAVTANLRQILHFRDVQASDEKLRRLARRTFQYFGKYLIDFFSFGRMTREEIDNIISVEHLKYFNQAREMDRGLIVTTAHFGSWELGGMAMESMGMPMHVVILPEENDRIRELFRRRRESRGMHVVPFGRAFRSLIRLLRDGEAVALLADRDYSSRNDKVMFFGKEARLPRGPAMLSMRTNTPILPGFLLREPDDTYLLRFYPPVLPENEQSMPAIQDGICRILEKEIGERPYQWFMFKEFWKNGTNGQ